MQRSVLNQQNPVQKELSKTTTDNPSFSQLISRLIKNIKDVKSVKYSISNEISVNRLIKPTMNFISKKSNPTGLYVVGTLYPFTTGGMEIFNYYFLLRQLKDRGKSIFYLSDKKIAHNKDEDIAEGNFIRYQKLRPSRLFYPVQFFFLIFRIRKLLDYAYISYAEQSWIISFSQSIILRLFRIPYIVTIHWGKEPEWKFRYPNVYFFKNAHSVIGVSEPICSSFQKKIPEQHFQYIPPIIPFTISPKSKSALKKELGFDEKNRILLFVGTLRSMKNPDKIVEAFRLIGNEYLYKHSIHLVFVGHGDMEEELVKMIRDYKLEKFITLAGLMNREQIPQYYRMSDCYIISSDYEGTSVSLLEAMANKSPIIASDAPGINKMLVHEHNALLYSTTKIEQLAVSIKRLFSDSSLAEKIANNAYADFADNYSFETMISEYNSIFSSVLD